MTLIVTEIDYDPQHKDGSRILCAADRRLTQDGQVVAEDRKLFKNRRLNATVSYFGLSDVPGWTFSELLASYAANDPSPTLRDFAHSIMRNLNALVPKDLLLKRASGLHVCGFTKNKVPQFWFIRNIGGMDGFTYVDFRDHYFISEELSEVHAREVYDSASGDFTTSLRAWFANGDLRSHQPAWILFEEFVREMETRGLSRAPVSAADFEKRLRFKMEAIGLYYTIVADEMLVGGGTDTFILPYDES